MYNGTLTVLLHDADRVLLCGFCIQGFSINPLLRIWFFGLRKENLLGVLKCFVSAGVAVVTSSIHMMNRGIGVGVNRGDFSLRLDPSIVPSSLVTSGIVLTLGVVAVFIMYLLLSFLELLSYLQLPAQTLFRLSYIWQQLYPLHLLHSG